MRKIPALLAITLIGSCFSFTQANELQTVTARLQETPLEQVLDGTVEAVRQSTVSAEISGRITEINFDVDDVVNKGNVLVKIRDNEYVARLQRAEAALNEAIAQFDDAKTEFARATDMFSKNVISEAQYDSAEAALKGAEARVAASRAAVSEAKDQLENTIVKAPYSGVVTERHVELGETVNPGSALMTGLSLEQLRTVVDVPQTFINAIRQHRQARIILLDDKQSIAGKSMTIFPYADPSRHTFRVRVNLPENISTLYPGMLVKVAFLTDTAQRLMIPEQALVQRSEVNAVYVVDDKGKVSLRQVRTGVANEEQVEILSGLQPGETIALDPVQAGIVLKEQAGEK